LEVEVVTEPPAAAWQPWAAIGGFALLLHFAWEMIQVPMYEGMAARAHWPAVLWCTQAAAGDSVISMGAYAGAAVRERNRFWLRSPRPASLLVFLGIGLLITVVLEWLNVHQWARWSYSARMVRVLGIGLSPVLQWTLLPPLTLWLARRHLAVAPDTSQS
jgi:hypothetical protein